MASFCTFWDPALGQTVRKDFGTGNCTGNLFGNCSAILGGIPSPTPSNCNCGDLSVIVMGECNVINTFGTPAANGCFNFIGNGCKQLITGENNFIGSGGSNQINTFVSGEFIISSAIAGGNQNTICDDGANAVFAGFIGGGSSNLVGGAFSSVVGGKNNFSFGCSSFIGGGEFNCVQQGQSTSNIVGGCSNIIGGIGVGALLTSLSLIGSGDQNCIDSTASVGTMYGIIGGGQFNKVCAGTNFASIFGGFTNTVDGSASFIGNGDTNAINSSSGAGPVNCAVIAGGQNNSISDNGSVTADYSFIGSGFTNNVFGQYASVVGGACNSACGQLSFVGGGGSTVATDGNTASGDLSGIVAGWKNTTIGCGSFVGAGSDNCADGGFSAVVAGCGNYACHCAFVGAGTNNKAVCMGFVGTGNQNCACGANYSFIGGGVSNVALCGGGIITGGFNLVSAGISAIGAGECNCICGGGASFIGAGECNSIFIGVSSVISAGCQNCVGNITAGAAFSFVGSGAGNCIDGGGPMPHETLWNSIGGGQSNKICGNVCNGAIFGGSNNRVAANASFIGAGDSNFIDSTGPTANPYGVIGGGQDNAVCAGATHSSIFSGFKNCVTSSCSSILGGSGNSIPVGFPNSHIIGSSIVLSAGLVGNPNTLHVNGLWANGIPVYTAGPGYTPGTVFIVTPGGPVPPGATGQLWIM